VDGYGLFFTLYSAELVASGRLSGHFVVNSKIENSPQEHVHALYILVFSQLDPGTAAHARMVFLPPTGCPSSSDIKMDCFATSWKILFDLLHYPSFSSGGEVDASATAVRIAVG
jgi:hypothetical protein